ncbi:hypothetical protein O181_061797 [Austropuccinia psidii MF-1]|uniref:Uncharacterized protein n=1 Tax=Austropuccinia psidii MF-1 TaxID=1389203 RepID=A0A9Q3ELF7_9BASI|nr:hypothetical protein [Austropuccinia psidii MF-1]
MLTVPLIIEGRLYGPINHLLKLESNQLKSEYGILHKKNMTINNHSGRCSVMIWGVFCGLFQSQIIIPPPGQQKAQDLIHNICEPGLLPFLKYLNKNMAINPEELILMEYCSLIHSAQVSEAWKQNHGIGKLQWPSNSP